MLNLERFKKRLGPSFTLNEKMKFKKYKEKYGPIFIVKE
jgi:hypothetical protein